MFNSSTFNTVNYGGVTAQVTKVTAYVAYVTRVALLLEQRPHDIILDQDNGGKTEGICLDQKSTSLMLQ